MVSLVSHLTQMNKIVAAKRGLPWVFTDKRFTAWGGLRVLEEMLSRLAWGEALGKAPLPKPGSNRGIDPVLKVQAFLVTIWTGGGRFAHTALVRFDEALRSIFGLEEVGCVTTFTRFFRQFKRQQVEEVFSYFSKWFWEQIGARNWTVDLDSSVLTRYGHQEGVRRGYNPTRRGKKSHHPLMAFAAEARMVITSWLRPGDTTDSSNAENFMREVLAVFGQRHRVGLLRGDSGFCTGDFLDLLEEKSLQYIVVARLRPTVKRKIAALNDWVEIDERMAVSEFMYQADGWSKPRRFVVVRQRIESVDRQPVLFEMPGYAISGYVTNLTLPPLQTRTLYLGRADSENRIKELLQDFAISGFVSQKFWATEAAFRLACLAYNLMSLFRQALLGAASKHTLSTLRTQCFAIGASLGKQGHKTVLRVGLPRARRHWFEGLFSSANALQGPYVLRSG